MGNYFFNFVDQQYKDTLEGSRAQKTQKNRQTGKYSANKKDAESKELSNLGTNEVTVTGGNVRQ